MQSTRILPARFLFRTGLFKRSILQSGNAFSPWAIENDPEFHARRLGRRAGYEGDDLEGLVQYLKNQSAEKLTKLADECHMEDRKVLYGDKSLCREVSLVLCRLNFFLCTE